MHHRALIARVCIAVLALVCACAATGMAPGDPPRITVMTWNIYFGAGDVDSAPDMGEVFESVEATNFAERAGRIARLIDQQQPQIVCLQEVARWRTEDFLGGDEDDIDFLGILLDRLAARGLTYDVVGAVETIDFEAPGDVGGDVLNVHWEERIVMLARRSGNLQVDVVRLKRFDDSYSIDIPVVGPLEFERGWIAADITYRGTRARFVCTHLEALSSGVRADQAAQLIDWLSGTNLPVIVLGDLNALPASGVYQQFTEAGYADVWAADHGLFDGPTCCQDGDLQNDTSLLAARIDHILARGDITPISSVRVGQKQSDRTPSGLWPSDHAGVVAKVRLD